MHSLLSSTDHEPANEPIQKVTTWVNSVCGPIQKARYHRLSGTERGWWLCALDLGRCEVGTRFCQRIVTASGTSLDPAEACRRGFGEAIERYSALTFADYDEQKLLYDDTPFRDELPKCANWEPAPIELRPDQSGVQIRHLAMRRLDDDQIVWVPAGWVDLNHFGAAGEPQAVAPISTGLAFSDSLIDAIWRGLCESFERDALMRLWWLQQPCPEIELRSRNFISTSTFPILERLDRLTTKGLTVRVFDMDPARSLPASAVMCLLSGDVYPYHTVGAACRADSVGCVTKAIDEAVAARIGLSNSKQLSINTDNYSWVHLLEHHALLYGGWRETPAFDFLLRPDRLVSPWSKWSEDRGSIPQTPTQLITLAIQLAKNGLTPLWTDVTTLDARKFGHIVKVFVPQHLPLTQGHCCRYLATPSLVQISGGKQGSADWNPYPHPFA